MRATLLLGAAAVGLALSGATAAAALPDTMVATTSACGGDTVAALLCMTNELLFGDNGLVPFGTHTIEFAKQVVFDIVNVVALPWGAL